MGSKWASNSNWPSAALKREVCAVDGHKREENQYRSLGKSVPARNEGGTAVVTVQTVAGTPQISWDLVVFNKRPHLVLPWVII